MKYKKVKIDLYSQTLHIIIVDDFSVAKTTPEFLKRFAGLEPIRDDFAGYAEARENQHLIILNKKHLNTPEYTLSTISHEAFHITNFIMKRVGIKPDVDNDEAQAYLLSYIVEEVYKFLNKS